MIYLPSNGTKDYAKCRRQYVYFAQRETDKLIKIGCSEKPTHRLKFLAREFCSTMTCLGLIPGGFDLEIKLHQTFADTAMGHEWFNPSPKLLDFIAQNAQPVEFEPPRHKAPTKGKTVEKNPIFRIRGNQVVVLWRNKQ